MKKNQKLKIDQLEPDLISCDINKPNQLNQSITENNIKNNLSADTVETKPSLRKTKTKTTRPSSVKKNKITKKKSPNKNKKNPNKNTKKVKFIEKIDIIKVECWKKYNLEQTAEEVEYPDDYLDDFELATDDNKTKANSNIDKNKTNDNKKNRINRNNKNGKGKKKKFSCACNII